MTCSMVVTQATRIWSSILTILICYKCVWTLWVLLMRSTHRVHTHLYRFFILGTLNSIPSSAHIVSLSVVLGTCYAYYGQYIHTLGTLVLVGELMSGLNRNAGESEGRNHWFLPPFHLQFIAFYHSHDHHESDRMREIERETMMINHLVYHHSYSFVPYCCAVTIPRCQSNSPAWWPYVSESRWCTTNMVSEMLICNYFFMECSIS